MGRVSSLSRIRTHSILLRFSRTDYAILPPEGVLTNVIGVVVLCYGVLSLYLVNDATYKRNSLPEENITLADNEEHQEPGDQ